MTARIGLLGIALAVVFAQGVEPASSLDLVADTLRHPVVSILLVVLGITGLIVEVKLPGATLPLGLAGLSFVLYFWAHAQTAGPIVIVAIVLFLLGLALLALEIFVIPGFGVTGTCGFGLVIVGLGVATLVKTPGTVVEWMGFSGTLLKIGAGLIAGLIGALLLGHYLPQIPIANRLLRLPKEEENEEAVGPPPENAARLGAIGVAATNLRPSGLAQFGDQFVDVITEGRYVDPGARVRVIEVEGNRVVVQEV